MKFASRRLLLAAVSLCAGWCATVQAQTLLGEFPLQGSLNDNLGGPALTLISYGGNTGTITSSGYVFSADQGLAYANPAFTPADFSVELTFQFDAISGYRKIIDFSNQQADSGFYNLSGNLNFYPVVTAATVDFSPGVNVDVVLTREAATNLVTGYINGQQRFSFTDSSSLAVSSAANGKLIFLADDFVQGYESSSGTLEYLRVYNGALSSAQVAALFAAGAPSPVPEPATAAAWLALASLGAAAARRPFRG